MFGRIAGHRSLTLAAALAAGGVLGGPTIAEQVNGVQHTWLAGTTGEGPATGADQHRHRPDARADPAGRDRRAGAAGRPARPRDPFRHFGRRRGQRQGAVRQVARRGHGAGLGDQAGHRDDRAGHPRPDVPAGHPAASRSEPGRGRTRRPAATRRSRSGPAARTPGAARLDDLAKQVKTSLGDVKPTKVIYDESLFSGDVLGPGWDPDTATGGYGSPITALMTDGARVNPKRATGGAQRYAKPDLAAAQAFARLLGVPG